MQKYMERLMKCPHLIKWVVSACKAAEMSYVPSLFELEEYCKTKSHRKCPFYLKNIVVKKEIDDSIAV
jgi:hypothetical protein